MNTRPALSPFFTLGSAQPRKAPRSPAAFSTITNTGSAPDRLIGGGVTGAARAEVHATSTEGGIARMHPVEGGIEIKPGETVKLAPGGYHLMFIDLKGSFVDGELVEGTLRFETAGGVPVEFEVQSVGARAPAPHGHRDEEPRLAPADRFACPVSGRAALSRRRKRVRPVRNTCPQRWISLCVLLPSI